MVFFVTTATEVDGACMSDVSPLDLMNCWKYQFHLVLHEWHEWKYYPFNNREYDGHTTLITNLNSLNKNSPVSRTQSTTKSQMITKLYPTELKNLYLLLSR